MVFFFFYVYPFSIKNKVLFYTNSEEKIIDNKNDSTDVSDTIEDKDMEMDIDAD